MARLTPLLLGQFKSCYRSLFARGSPEVMGLTILLIACGGLVQRFLSLASSLSSGTAVAVLATTWLFFLISGAAGIEVASTLRQFPLSEVDLGLLRLARLGANPFAWLLVYATVSIAQATSPAAYLLSGAAIFAGVATASFGPRRHSRSRQPGRWAALPLPVLLRKDVKAAFRLLETLLACMVVAMFLVYLIRETNPAIEAVLIVPVIVALANTTLALNLFGCDTACGLDRYVLLPLTGRQIVREKVVSMSAVLALQFLPVVTAVFWRLGPRAALVAFVECLSLGLIITAWGALITVHHAHILKPYRFSEGGSLFSSLFAFPLCVIPGFVAASQDPWLSAAVPVIAAVGLYFALNSAGRTLQENPDRVRTRLH